MQRKRSRRRRQHCAAAVRCAGIDNYTSADDAIKDAYETSYVVLSAGCLGLYTQCNDDDDDHVVIVSAVCYSSLCLVCDSVF